MLSQSMEALPGGPASPFYEVLAHDTAFLPRVLPSKLETHAVPVGSCHAPFFKVPNFVVIDSKPRS